MAIITSTSKTPKTTQIIGWYGRKNIGDESYKLSFPICFPNSNIIFGGEFENADACILGGGDILNDHYIQKLLDHPAPKKYTISTAVNANTPFSKLKQLDGVYVRDLRSIDLLNSHSVPCRYIPDVSLTLEPNRKKGREYIEKTFHGHDLYDRVIGVVLNCHLFQSKPPDLLTRDFITFWKVIYDLVSVIDNTSASFVFFPMCTGLPYDDRVTNSILASRCKFWKKNVVVYDELDVQDTLNLISACDAVISTRLHSSIFCLASSVPSVDLIHHDKSKCFLESVGLIENSVSYWNMDVSVVKNMLNNLPDKGSLDEKRYEQLCILGEEIKHVSLS